MANKNWSTGKRELAWKTHTRMSDGSEFGSGLYYILRSDVKGLTKGNAGNVYLFKTSDWRIFILQSLSSV